VAEQDQLAHGVSIEGVSANVGLVEAKRKPGIGVCSANVPGFPFAGISPTQRRKRRSGFSRDPNNPQPAVTPSGAFMRRLDL
jgi:hypothetical protein